MELIESAAAPIPLGHYSQAVKANGFVFVSGQLPLIPGGERRMPEGIEAQARQTLENMRQILLAAGSSVDRLVSVQIFIPDVAMWPPVNRIYEEFMGAHRPARSVIPTRDLHLGALIEINAIAVVG